MRRSTINRNILAHRSENAVEIDTLSAPSNAKKWETYAQDSHNPKGHDIPGKLLNLERGKLREVIAKSECGFVFHVEAECSFKERT